MLKSKLEKSLKKKYILTHSERKDLRNLSKKERLKFKKSVTIVKRIVYIKILEFIKNLEKDEKEMGNR